MIYGDICSGISAPTVAWRELGWRAAFYSEIERFPRAVLAHHYPDVPLHGDFTTIEAGQYEPIDLLVGGTPCQDFSVAGLRRGLDGERGQLTIEFLALAGRLRPRWLVWENVPGVLSIDGGRAFGLFLGRMGQLGYGFAYRVLDAQHFGVPQRRRRVFVVGHLGDWRAAAAVLFERHSLSGNPPPRREKGQGIAGTFSAGAHPGSYNGQDAGNNLLIAHSLRADGFDASEDGTGRGTPLVPVAFAQNQRGEVLCKDIMDGFKVGGGKPGQGYPAIAIQEVGKRTGASTTDVRAGIGIADPGEPMFTLQAGAQHGVGHHMAVRRLTPRECERLQGFPDNYTLIPYRGKSAADGPRYKALGNSMAVPVLRWIGQRIRLVNRAILSLEAA